MTKADAERLIKLLDAFGESGRAVIRNSRRLKSPAARVRYLLAAAQHFRRHWGERAKYLRLPVDVQTFIEGEDFLNQPDVIYPKIMEELVEANSGHYVEAVLTGGIGTGKTTMALFSQAYQLYLLSCLKNPHAEFDLDPSSEIVFVFQSIRKELAKTVDFMRFKAMIDRAVYFDRHFPYRKDLTSEMHFPKRIIVKPLSGSVDAAIGQNIIAGVIDEINFMVIVEGSKQTRDGGLFDQANEIYNSIVRRRKSRFLQQGHLPGLLCLVSSKQFPGEFTERKAEEATRQLRATGTTDIYVYDKRVWDVKPEVSFSGVWFDVFTGDMTRRPRVLEAGEEVAPEDRHLVLAVPEEYRSEFERDILSALRDIGGVSTQALNPFLMNVNAVSACFGKAPAIVSRTDADFVTSKLEIYPKRIIRPQEPRFVHVDLALRSDSCGVSMGWVTGFTTMQRREEAERLPNIRFDFTLEVRPPKGGEIQIENVRALLYKLRAMGVNIRWVTADTYQSADTLQILTSNGFITGTQSMDSDTRAYDVLKTALYDGRVELPEHQRALTELIRLERVDRTGKVDHPPKGSKDIADSIAGVVYGLSLRREIWHLHGIPPVVIPRSLLAQETTYKGNVSAKEAYMQTVKREMYDDAVQVRQ